MAFLNTMSIVGSGLTAQQLRLDVISENIPNSTTTRTENGGETYRRKVVYFESNSGANSFRAAMARAARGLPVSKDGEKVGGVRVAQILEDPSDFKLVYDPTHPDADEEGYVSLPNVDMVKEITDAMAASQAYSSNVTVFNTIKTVALRGLDLGK